MIKKLPFVIGALLLSTFYSASAQVKMAPNYFKADPAVCKYRMKSVIAWKDTQYEMKTTYTYDDNGLLIREESGEQNSENLITSNYSYDKNGYLVKKENVEINAYGTEKIVTHKEVYVRNEKGYPLEYHRYTLHGPDPDNLVLTEDVIVLFNYDSENRLTNAEIRQYDYILEMLEENIGRICRVEYNEIGKVSKVSQFLPGNELIWYEEFTYDDKGRRTAISKICGSAYNADSGDIIWSWVYDEEGDIIESGREDFMKSFTYDKSKKASETFMPLEGAEGDWVLLGPVNCTLFRELPIEKYFTHAVTGEISTESVVTYEEVPISTVIDTTVADDANIVVTVNGNVLSVNIPAELVGKRLSIFSATGVIIYSEIVTDVRQNIGVGKLNAGLYVLEIGGKTAKFIKR
ncbi:T9SS C-terminal target domain-containing protein [Prevotella sp. OH937_COT-195]|uniref:T9SS C-terminal target domain-containing protein n=1 Tax=Prevotella sp. OH937_COT-195 TaxID=2491051 RepID=UPI000F64B1CE|nr:T9SS C-terminal target domain-containing protein [Prevotella sp. OH937_COT-195]RRD02528.1 T9SS C-terminal target domain-containing protein [Prevotella sp. OH937_COT-195]